LGCLQVVIVEGEELATCARGLDLGEQLAVVEKDPFAPRPSARMCGVMQASGELVAFLAPGDHWGPGHLERTLPLLEADSRLGLVLGAVEEVGSDELLFVRPPGKGLLEERAESVVGRDGLEGILQSWTVSSVVAWRSCLMFAAEPLGMLLDRSPDPDVDARKWSAFLSRWRIAGVVPPEHAPVTSPFQNLLPHPSSRAGFEATFEDPALERLAAESVALLAKAGGRRLEYEHGDPAPGAASIIILSTHLLRVALVEQALDGTASSWRQTAADGDRIRDLTRLDKALADLGKWEPELEVLVELSFFRSLSVKDVALVLDKPLRVVRRDWLIARTWLRKQLETCSA
jgi:hypothetical protein